MIIFEIIVLREVFFMLNKISQFTTKTFIVDDFSSYHWFDVPQQFAGLGSFVPYLLGIVMLGMGMTISPKDFKIVLNHLDQSL